VIAVIRRSKIERTDVAPGRRKEMRQVVIPERLADAQKGTGHQTRIAAVKQKRIDAMRLRGCRSLIPAVIVPDDVT
jgi:hypothetical protein